jgi:hypothetical protein
MSDRPAQATFKLRRAQLLAPEQQPWRRGLPVLSEINPIPGMICEDESRFLHWIARHAVSGDGHIVDLGPLAGGSTHALCSGLALNPRASGRTRVHSYDLWRFLPGWESFFPGAALRLGDNLHPLFARNLQAFGDVVVSHQGGLRRQRWGGEPIEILFIDVAKASGLWAHILREFFPRCIPGRTLIVHQDWVSAECPWIHLTMARLSDYFVPVDSPEGGTVAFRLERAIPPALLQEGDFLALPAATASARFEQAAAWLVGWYGLAVLLAQAHYCVMRGQPEEAARGLSQVLAHADYAADLQYDVDLVLAALRKRGQEASRLPHQRWLDACARMLRRAALAVRVRCS